MLSIEALAAYGADVNEGLARCMGMEAFYLDLVKKELDDPYIAKLEVAVSAGDSKAAFEAAHALKGALGNLSLTPAAEVVSALCERYRGAEGPVDVSDLMPVYKKAMDALKTLAD